MCLCCVTSGNGLVKCHQILSAANAGWKRKEKTMPFGVNLMRSQVLYRAAQVQVGQVLWHLVFWRCIHIVNMSGAAVQ